MYGDPTTGRRNVVGRVVGRLASFRSVLTVDVPICIWYLICLAQILNAFRLTTYQPTMTNPIPFKSFTPYYKTWAPIAFTYLTGPMLHWVLYYDWAICFTLAVTTGSFALGLSTMAAIMFGVDWKNCWKTLWCADVQDYVMLLGVPVITYRDPAHSYKPAPSFLVTTVLFFVMIPLFICYILYAIYLRWSEYPRILGEATATDAAILGFKREEGSEKKEFAQHTVIDIFGRKILLKTVLVDVCCNILVLMVFLGIWNIPRLNVYEPSMANPLESFQPFWSAASWIIVSAMIPMLCWTMCFYRRVGAVATYAVISSALLGWSIAMLCVQANVWSNCGSYLWCQKLIDYQVIAGVTTTFQDSPLDVGKPAMTFTFNFVMHAISIVFGLLAIIFPCWVQYDYFSRNQDLDSTAQGRSLIRSALTEERGEDAPLINLRGKSGKSKSKQVKAPINDYNVGGGDDDSSNSTGAKQRKRRSGGN